MRRMSLPPCFSTSAELLPRLSGIGLVLVLGFACMPANAATLCVATNSRFPAPPYNAWSNAAHTIQEAVNLAGTGDTVLVTNGTYSAGGAPRPGLTHTNRICATKAITVTSVNGPEYTIVLGNGTRCAYLTNGVTLTGFTLRDSEAAAGTCLVEDTGGGVIMTHGAVVISNCIVANGSCYCYGGGIYNVDYDQAVIANCLIKNNTSHAYAGGVYYGNLYNCTIVSNHCDLEAGGVGQADVRNCIVLYNTTGGSYPNIRYGSVQYTCSVPAPAGTGNIEADACFVDEDYRLAWDSPCINAGNSAAAQGDSDLDGCPRISDVVDMGCYEAPQGGERALTFDSGDVVQTPDAENLDDGLEEAFTIEAWFRTPFMDNQILLAKHNTNLDGSYYLAVTASGDLRFTLINSNTNRVDHDTAVDYADNQWHHIAAIYDGTQMRLLFDGSAVGGSSAQTGTVCNTAHPMRLGSTASDAWQFYGDLDEVRLWNTDLTDTDIHGNMHRQQVGNESNLVLSLRLNQIEGHAVRDWAHPGRSVFCSGASWTDSDAVLGSTRVMQKVDLRGAWISQTEMDPDSVNGAGIYGTFATSSDNIIWGHNERSGITNAAFALNGTGDVQQLQRIWYIDTSGTPTDTDLFIDLASADAAGVAGAPAENYHLLRSTSSGGVFMVVTNGLTMTGTEVAFSGPSLDTGYYTLAVRGPIETGPATNIAALTATLQGTVWGWAGLVTNILFEYGTNIDYGLTVVAEPSMYGAGGSSSVSGNVANLGPGVTYHYRLSAVVENTLIQGVDRTFTTRNVKVETGGVTNMALWSCTMEGIVNPDGDLATNILFEYGLASNDLAETASATPQTLSSTTDELVTANAPILALGSRHFYRLSVMFGPAEKLGETLSFISSVTNPIADPPNDHTYNSFAARWQGVPGATNYLLDVSATNTFTYFHPGYENFIVGTGTTCVASGIVEGVTYYYRVSAQFPEAASGESDAMAILHPVYPSHYVSPSGLGQWPYTNWTCAATQLQQALKIAVSGDTVYAAAGVYNTGGQAGPYGLTNRAYLRKGISLIGNGPGASIIVGASDAASTCGPAAVRCILMDGDSHLVGFQLTNGHTLTSGPDANGGGLARSYDGGGTANVSNCLITGCRADKQGGGAWLTSYALTLTDCRLLGNKAEKGGGAYGLDARRCRFTQNEAQDGGGASQCELNDCDVSSNTASQYGGGLYDCMAYGSTVAVNYAQAGGGVGHSDVYQCSIAGNSALSGGGLWDSYASFTLIADNDADDGGGAYDSYLHACRIEDNIAGFGGGLYQTEAYSCLIIGNTAWKGGGSGYGSLAASTVVSNYAAQGGGGTYRDTADSCIILLNSASADSNWLEGTLNYSCSTPLPPGTGNITDDPGFVGSGDWRLPTGSPCIDAGNTNFATLYGSGSDLDFMMRPLDSDHDGTPIVDMGCYELLHVSADSDGDTMLDAWEISHRLSPTSPTDAPLDSDGDEDINLLEHIADTDPWDSNDWFHIQHMQRTNSCAIGFVGSTGRVYTLYWSTNLAATSWQTVEGCVCLSGSGANTELVDTNNTSHRCYNVGVSLVP